MQRGELVTISEEKLLEQMYYRAGHSGQLDARKCARLGAKFCGIWRCR
jgi:hypothetical protein